MKKLGASPNLHTEYQPIEIIGDALRPIRSGEPTIGGGADQPHLRITVNHRGYFGQRHAEILRNPRHDQKERSEVEGVESPHERVAATQAYRWSFVLPTPWDRLSRRPS